MAQAISAHSGWRSLRARGHPPGIGLLLGIRSYAAPAGDFLCGETLDVEVIESSEDEEGSLTFVIILLLLLLALCTLMLSFGSSL